MTKLPADLEALMPEGDHARNFDEFAVVFTADQVREAMLAATERAAKIAQAMLDTEGDVGGDDWTPEMAWDWACQQIRNAIRGIDATAQALDGEAGEPT